jgi:hypothetical protein
MWLNTLSLIYLGVSRNNSIIGNSRINSYYLFLLLNVFLDFMLIIVNPSKYLSMNSLVNSIPNVSSNQMLKPIVHQVNQVLKLEWKAIQVVWDQILNNAMSHYDWLTMYDRM